MFVPQGQIGEFEVGAPVSLKVDTYDESFGGRVEYISQSTEFTPRFLFSPSLGEWALFSRAFFGRAFEAWYRELR